MSNSTEFVSNSTEFVDDCDCYNPIRYHFIDRTRNYPSVDFPFKRTFKCYKDADDYLHPRISKFNFDMDEKERKPSANKNNKNDFVVNIDVQHFKPEEIAVKTEKNSILVYAKHDEKQDEQGFISRQFTRRYELPNGFNTDDVVSSLSSDGILTVKCASPVVKSVDRRQVPIQQTGQPAESSVKSNVEKKDGKETPLA